LVQTRVNAVVDIAASIYTFPDSLPTGYVIYVRDHTKQGTVRVVPAFVSAASTDEERCTRFTDFFSCCLANPVGEACISLPTASRQSVRCAWSVLSSWGAIRKPTDGRYYRN